MSIPSGFPSKEERLAIEERLGERWLFETDHEGFRHERPTFGRINAAQLDVYTLLEALNKADSTIAELQAAEARWRGQLNHIEAYCEDYAHDITTAHKMMRKVCEIVGVEMAPDR